VRSCPPRHRPAGPTGPGDLFVSGLLGVLLAGLGAFAITTGLGIYVTAALMLRRGCKSWLIKAFPPPRIT